MNIFVNIITNIFDFAFIPIPVLLLAKAWNYFSFWYLCRACIFLWFWFTYKQL